MSLFFSPRFFRFELPAVVGGGRPVQLPFLIFLAGDLPAPELLLTKHPLSHEAVKDVVIKADCHALMRQVGIRVIDGFDKVHPWVRRITYEGRLILRGSEAYPSHRK